MSSYLVGAGRNTAAAAAAAATYGFDLEIEHLKSASASIRASPYSSSSSSSSSSTNSTISESSNYLSPPLSICTRKPRTPRKRPNQTYNEAAALLSTAYPNLFSPKHLAKPPSFKFAKPIDATSWLNSSIGEELLLPLSLPEKPLERRLGLISGSSCSNYSDSSSDKPCRSPMEENAYREDDDFETESILDEELGGIDSIMGNLTVGGDNCDDNQHQQARNLCYGLPMGLGLGLQDGRFDFGYGMRKEVTALRNSPNREWCRYPAMTTVDVETISPRQPAVEKKKASCKKKKKTPEANASIAAVPPPSISDCRIQLKLNFDEVLSAWSDRGSPFSDDSLAPELSGSDVRTRLAKIDLFGESEGVRKASVQRYRDKRRTRLNSNKTATKEGRLMLINASG